MEKKFKLHLTDIVVAILMIIPWSIHGGSTSTNKLSGSVDLTIIQFWLYRIIISGDERRVEFLTGRGDALYGFFFLFATILFTYVEIVRIWRAISYFLSNDTLTRIYLLKRNLTFSKDDSDIEINRELNTASTAAALLFSTIFMVLASVFAYRDVFQNAYDIQGVEWGKIVDGTPLIEYFFPTGTSITSFYPIVIVLLLVGMTYEASSDKYAFVNSIGNFIRFGIIGLFVVISIFPLIWVLIVSVNEQRTIQAGFPLWPLDPTRKLNFDSYERFFHFTGSWIAWGYFIFSGLMGFLIYHQLNNSGKWQDRIQGFIYDKISNKFASNRNTSLIFLIMMLVEFTAFIISISMIVAQENFLGLPPGGFTWTLIDSTGSVRHIGNWFIVTTIICTGVSVYGLIMACLSAYALSRFNFPAKNGFISVVLGTQMFPGIILLLPLLVMWNELKLTNSIFGLTLAYATFAVPFSTFMMKGYFDSIPKDLEEAAMVDGSTHLGAFTRVILPISLPGLASTFLFSFLTGYTEYLLALTLYQAPEPEYTISLALINVFRTDLQYYYFPDLALFSIIVALPILLIFVYLQKFLIAGLASGGIKG